jgi:hypothetical protein
MSEKSVFDDFCGYLDLTNILSEKFKDVLKQKVLLAIKDAYQRGLNDANPKGSH